MPDALAQGVLHLVQVLQAADIALFRCVNAGCAHPLLDPVMVLVTQLGLGTVQLAFLVLLYTFGGRAGRRVAFLSLLAFLISGAAAQILKNAVDRRRPGLIVEECRFMAEVLRYHSFPSGHTATSFAIALVASAHYRRWLIPLLFTAAMVGVSRVYIGVHFPGDALAGAVIGIATAVACLHEAPPEYKALDDAPSHSVG